MYLYNQAKYFCFDRLSTSYVLSDGGLTIFHTGIGDHSFNSKITTHPKLECFNFRMLKKTRR